MCKSVITHDGRQLINQRQSVKHDVCIINSIYCGSVQAATLIYCNVGFGNRRRIQAQKRRGGWGKVAFSACAKIRPFCHTPSSTWTYYKTGEQQELA